MSATARIRREGPSVHHVLCSLRRPPTAWAECTCRVPEVASALADLLDALRRTEGVLQDVYVWNAYEALEAAVDRSGT